MNPIRGVIHVGAHHGEERKAYEACGVHNVIWFEAFPDSFAKLTHNVKHLPSNVTFNVALSDIDGRCKFHVTDNGRGNNSSSSMLELGKHATYYPHVKVKDVIEVETSRLDSLAAKQSLNMSEYNFLNIDVQGAELHVLRGMGELLNNIDYILTEVNEAELYKGGVLLHDLAAYLNVHGFSLVDRVMTKYEWGDALFVKKELTGGSSV